MDMKIKCLKKAEHGYRSKWYNPDGDNLAKSTSQFVRITDDLLLQKMFVTFVRKSQLNIIRPPNIFPIDPMRVM